MRRILRSVAVLVGVGFSVAFLPSTAWAACDTTGPTGAYLWPVTDPACALGTASNPSVVVLPGEWMAGFLLIGALMVALLAALVLTTWGER